MSDGATMSAPARAWLTAVRASSSSVASLSTDAVVAQHPAVAVLGVLAQADVGHHEQVGPRALDRARGELHRALGVPGAGALLVLLGGYPEQQHGGEAEPRGVLCLGDGGGDREPLDPGHRRDRLAGPEPSPAARDEQRQHQPVSGEVGLAHEAAQASRGAQPAHARLWEGHRSPG